KIDSQSTCRAAIEITGAAQSTIDLVLEQRATRGVVELTGDRSTIVVLLRQCLLRGADSLRRGVDRRRLGTRQSSTATQGYRVLQLDGERCTGGHVHVAAFGQQTAQRGEDGVHAVARSGAGDSCSNSTTLTDEHDVRVGIALDLGSLGGVSAGELAGDREGRAVGKGDTIEHDVYDARLLAGCGRGHLDDAADPASGRDDRVLIDADAFDDVGLERLPGPGACRLKRCVGANDDDASGGQYYP